MNIKNINKEKGKLLHSHFSFWLGIVVLGVLLGAAIQFTRAWVEPSLTVSPPAGLIEAPINTGAATQKKVGGDICVNINNQTVCLSSSSSAFPQGTIVIWSGAPSTIPAGWALCDGTNGTPDLRNRFIFGSAAGENPGSAGSISVSGMDWQGYDTGRCAQGCGGHSVSPGSYYSPAFIMKMTNN